MQRPPLLLLLLQLHRPIMCNLETRKRIHLHQHLRCVLCHATAQLVIVNLLQLCS